MQLYYILMYVSLSQSKEITGNMSHIPLFTRAMQHLDVAQPRKVACLLFDLKAIEYYAEGSYL